MGSMETFTFQNEADTYRTTVFMANVYKICWLEDKAILFFKFSVGEDIVKQDVIGKKNVLALCSVLGWRGE